MGEIKALPEMCAGCDHSLDTHVQSVSGAVVCMVSRSGVSRSGIIGIPYHSHCDCRDYQSREGYARRERDKKERGEWEEATQKLVEQARRALQQPGESTHGNQGGSNG